MSNNSYLSNALYAADDKAAYDAGAKKILADKQVLAWILKSCTKEFKEYPIRVIQECIEGTPEIASIPLLRAKPEAITGMPNEDNVPNEGGTRFDIRFYVTTPSGEHIKLIIDLEAQKSFYPGYSIAARGVFYGARMISAQYGVEFVNNDYDSIKKVYSIWICMNAPKYAVNTITEYSLQPRCIHGKLGGRMKYDLLSVILIGMGTEDESENGAELHKILSLLLSETWKPEEKEKYLKGKYGFDIGHEMKGVWQDMCNLSELIEEKGIEKGTYCTLCRLVRSGKLTVEEAAATADISVDEMSRIIEGMEAFR